MADYRVLVVDDEEDSRALLAQALSGYVVETAESAEAALEHLDSRAFDLVLLDHIMPGLSGLEALPLIKEKQVHCDVVMVTAVSELSLVVECIKKGADDYLVKPIVLDALRHKVRSLEERRRLIEENRRLRAAFDEAHPFDGMIGESPPMMELLAKIEKVSNANTPVLIHGESGTGKELVARAIHADSDRRAERFVAVNCAALNDELLVSELFGHVQGAFTDAREARPGLFLSADRGTLFLDEIGEIGPGFQAKLLRVLQEHEVMPVGGTEAIPIDTRVIAATNKDLTSEVERGQFREDLYFRLWVFDIKVPPLRERGDDVRLLALHFLDAYCRHIHREVQGIEEEAINLLMQYRWPGNVRELQNAIERAVILEESDRLTAASFSLGTERSRTRRRTDTEGSWAESRCRFEKTYVEDRLRESGGNVTRAAKAAGIDRTNFRKKMGAHGIQAESFKRSKS